MNTRFLAAALLLSSGVATGQVTRIPPFVGSAPEDFEGPGTSGYACLPQRLFDDHADACTLIGSQFHVASSVFVGIPGTGACTIDAHGGNKLYAVKNSAFVITFDQPVRRFGGWFGHAVDWLPVPDDIEFYDVNGVQLGEDHPALTYDCAPTRSAAKRSWSPTTCKPTSARCRRATAPRARAAKAASRGSAPTLSPTSTTTSTSSSPCARPTASAAASCSTGSQRRRRRGARPAARASCASSRR
jgi:hypothetical protein